MNARNSTSTPTTVVTKASQEAVDNKRPKERRNKVRSRG